MTRIERIDADLIAQVCRIATLSESFRFAAIRQSASIRVLFFSAVLAH